MSIYALKPRFQALLRPLVGRLAAIGVTANQVTILALALSLALSAWLLFAPDRRLFLLLPPWMLARMALNAVDGMLAREFGQKSALGAFLNELADVIADAALALPFMLLAPFQALAVVIVIVLAAVSEMAGTVAVMIGASRRYDGPMGKRDRAFVFGLLALAVGFEVQPESPIFRWIFPLVAVLLVWTIVNRVKNGLAEVTR